MRFIGIIPSRMGSTRFPNKPLVDICGKPMIQHVYERAKKCLDIVYVATDHAKIFDTVINFGGEAVMTPACNSGTDRCWLAYQKIKKLIPYPKIEGLYIEPDIVINIQGDQPLLHYDHIRTIRDCFVDRHSLPEVVTVAYKDEGRNPWYNKNKATVVFNEDYYAMYFSRYVLPYGAQCTYQHIGIYAYLIPALNKFHELLPSYLEKAEKLEQNRWLEKGYYIKVGITAMSSMSVDTEEDLYKVIEIMKITDKMK